jgi:signal transduction histidine kinase
LQITERERAEAKSQKMQQMLFQSQKMESLGTLAGGVAHEINNLLQPIIGLSEIVRDDLPAESLTLRDDLGTVVDSALQARDIVKNILLFSRKERQETKAVDLGPEIRAAESLVRRLLPAGVSIVDDIPDVVCSTVIDRTGLTQVLTNLVVNAAQAMNDHGVIRVKLDQKKVAAQDANVLEIAPGSYAEVSVIDTGCGIDPTHHARIFEPFYTSKSVGKGTGLGLSVAYGIVRSWKGAIRIESAVGVGTTFSILIPVGAG